jgi:hypothetical protein
MFINGLMAMVIVAAAKLAKEPGHRSKAISESINLVILSAAKDLDSSVALFPQNDNDSYF